MAVPALFSPEKATYGRKVEKLLMGDDGGTVQGGDPVVHAIDQQQCFCIDGSLRRPTAQGKLSKADELIQIQKGVMNISQSPKAIIDGGDGRFHSAVDPAYADSGIHLMAGEHIANGIASHAVAEEDHVLAAEIVLGFGKGQGGIQVCRRLRKAPAGASFTAEAAGIIKGEHTASGFEKVPDLGAVGKSSIAQTGSNDHKGISCAEQVALKGSRAAFELHGDVGTAKGIGILSVEAPETPTVDQNCHNK